MMFEMTRFKSITLLIGALLLSKTVLATSIPNEQLSQWVLTGKGFSAYDKSNDQVVLSEEPGSSGVMLISPSPLDENTILNFDIRPLTPESVLVTQINLSDIGPSKKVTFKKDYDGNMNVLAKEKESYFFAYHNAAHKRKPFVRKYPQKGDVQKELEELDKNLMTTQWYHVEIGKKNQTIWMKVDGKEIIKVDDPKPLHEGHIAFRLRGTTNNIAIAIIKNLTITP
ncbi:DUF6250 domain-containing protein [Candidatus Sororendozoicomonas aggregata]|uniref:DUF6250 domain-containing protein n=1 Tax=Candidatus Sororendozoicomonas aggregata TaxID=3073239 RepID=UPI002ED12CEA